eukprot:COSAG02_NODE_10345_length_1963_cov_1.461910_2_plen_63_part_01
MSDISVHAIANGVQIMVEIQRQIIILYGSLPSQFCQTTNPIGRHYQRLEDQLLPLPRLSVHLL